MLNILKTKVAENGHLFFFEISEIVPTSDLFEMTCKGVRPLLVQILDTGEQDIGETRARDCVRVREPPR